MASKANFVAKHSWKVNKASVHRDIKNDYVRESCSLKDCLDEWEEEQLEQFTEDSELES